jgi:hypothetical protein
MSTSARTHFLSEILEGSPIPKGKLAFFQERFRDHLYELVVSEFLRKEKEGLTRSDVAKRIHRKPEQITRWLSAPGNWEIDTVSDLLLAISQAEPRISLSPLTERIETSSIPYGGENRPEPGVNFMLPKDTRAEANNIILAVAA